MGSLNIVQLIDDCLSESYEKIKFGDLKSVQCFAELLKTKIGEKE